MKTWLWLEDQRETTADMEVRLREAGMNLRWFRTPGELINTLVEWRDKEPERLDQVGLLLDVLLMGQPFIVAPTEWCRHLQPGAKSQRWKTRRGYDAGLVFFEQFVLNMEGDKPFWPNRLPPVVFLTILNTQAEEFQQRLQGIREYCEESVDRGECKVAGVHKWDARADKQIVNILREWRELG